MAEKNSFLHTEPAPKKKGKPRGPHPWPTNQMEARDRTREASVEGQAALKPIITSSKIADPEILKALAVVDHNLGYIQNLMEKAGAKSAMDPEMWSMPRGAYCGR